MKKFILGLLLILYGSIYAQTDIIALKSHHGNAHAIEREQDNFGLPSPTLDSIIYVGNNKIVYARTHFGGEVTFDTVTRPPLFMEHDFDLSEIRQSYGENVKFLGFEKRKHEKRLLRKKSNNKKGMIWPILIVSLATILFIPNKRKQLL